MSFSGIPKAFKRGISPQTPKKIESVEKRHFNLESSSVDIEARLFSPENRVEGKAIIFFPGWSMGVESTSTTLLAESLSKESASDTYALTARLEERGKAQAEDPLYEEAQAVAEYIKEKNLTDITLVGHSQGGDRAVTLTALLQKNSNITVSGLILINPVGMYEQGSAELVRKFTGNYVYTGVSVAKEIATSQKKGVAAITPALQASTDVVRGIAKEVGTSRLQYASRFRSEVGEMAQKNKHAQEITVPIVIVTGMSDSVSDASRIVPTDQVETLKDSLGEVAKANATAEVPQRDTTLRAREAHLQESLFPKSPYVRMLVPEKLGVHALPFLRPESVAKTSLYMLERFKRNTAGGKTP